MDNETEWSEDEIDELRGRVMMFEDDAARLRTELDMAIAVIDAIRDWLKSGASVSAIEPDGRVLEIAEGKLLWGGLRVSYTPRGWSNGELVTLRTRIAELEASNAALSAIETAARDYCDSKTFYSFQKLRAALAANPKPQEGT